MGKHAKPISGVHDISENQEMLRIVAILSEAAVAMRVVSEETRSHNATSVQAAIDALLAASVRVLG